MYASEMTPADIAACTGGGNNRDGGFFGGDWMGLIVLFLLFGMFGGGFGFGGFGGMGGFGGLNGGGFLGAELQRGFENQNVIRKLDEQTYGIADATYALNNTITNGFHGVERELCGISREIGDCCCQTQRSIDNVRFDLAKGFCDIGNVIHNTTRDVIDNQNANSRAILDFLVKDKIDTLTAENQSLKFQASQTAQNAYIGATVDSAVAELIRRTGNDYPQPAFVVQPPQPVTFPTNC